MTDLVRCVYEYRNLLGRRDLLRMRLDEAEQRRLTTLARTLEWRSEDLGPSGFSPSLRRRHARAEVKIEATVKAAGSLVPATVVNLGGGGLALDPAPRLRAGELTVVRFVDAERGREIHFPMRVEWKDERLLGPVVGLSFFGIPIELRYGGARAAAAAAA